MEGRRPPLTAAQREKEDANAHLDILLVLDDVLRDLEPELLPQLVVVLRHVRIDLRELQVSLFERKVHAVLPEAHLRVYVHTGLRPASLLAQSQRVVEIVVRLPCERI